MNSINWKKNDLTKSDFDFEKDYSPYVINKCVANSQDTVFYSSTISRYSWIIPKKYQYLYYLHSLRPKRRFGAWFKKGKEEDLKNIQEYYNVSERIAEEYLELLTTEQLQAIGKKLFKGGTNK